MSYQKRTVKQVESNLEVHFLLSEEYEFLQIKLKKLKQELVLAKYAIAESLEQSSETWHDNAPFETALEKEKGIISELYEVERLLSDALVVDKHEKLGRVFKIEVCSTLKQEAETRFYLLSALSLDPNVYEKRLSSFSSQIISSVKIASLKSPIGKELFSCSENESFVVNNMRFLVLKIL